MPSVGAGKFEAYRPAVLDEQGLTGLYWGFVCVNQFDLSSLYIVALSCRIN